jgi:hypothetical protein
MADHEPYKLFVFILGESSPSDNMFGITAEANISVSELRRRIYTETQHSLEGVNAKDLALWKVLPLCSFPFVMF